MTANPLIPLQSHTQLPGADFRAPTGIVEGNAPAPPQPGTRPTPVTGKGSGVFGAPGSVLPLTTPVRDFVVILRNTSDRDFRMRYLTVEYRIAAHDELIVQWEVMVSFMGSPETMNLGPRRMDRKQVYEKLRVKYGAYYDDELWEQNKPPLEAYRVTGERITTVVDDPDGLTVSVGQQSQQEQLANAATIANMQQQLEAMSRLVASITGQAQSTGESLIPQSIDTTVPEEMPMAPDFVPGNMEPGAIPNPVPHMTPSMPVGPIGPPAVQPGYQPGPVVPSTLHNEAPAPDHQPQGATPDVPANTVRIS